LHWGVKISFIHRKGTLGIMPKAQKYQGGAVRIQRHSCENH
jgi:hypothetical protein